MQGVGKGLSSSRKFRLERRTSENVNPEEYQLKNIFNYINKKSEKLYSIETKRRSEMIKEAIELFRARR
jgi:hypothetical protein